MFKTKFDIYGDQVARMRLKQIEDEKNASSKPAARPALIKPDYMEVIVETVKLEGSLKVLASELSALCCFPGKNQKALNSFLRAVYAKGINYSFQGGCPVGEITFSVQNRLPRLNPTPTLKMPLHRSRRDDRGEALETLVRGYYSNDNQKTR